jgi:hypothetical protein
MKQPKPVKQPAPDTPTGPGATTETAPKQPGDMV